MVVCEGVSGKCAVMMKDDRFQWRRTAPQTRGCRMAARMSHLSAVDKGANEREAVMNTGAGECKCSLACISYHVHQPQVC